MKYETISYTLGTQFASYVANGDDSHLTNQEVGDFEMIDQQAHDTAPSGYHFAHWDIKTDQYDEFAKCEATDLMGNCYQFDAVYFANEEETSHD